MRNVSQVREYGPYIKTGLVLMLVLQALRSLELCSVHTSSSLMTGAGAEALPQRERSEEVSLPRGRHADLGS